MTNKFATGYDVIQGWHCTVATANTSRTGASGTFVKLMDAGNNGSKVDAIVIEPQAAIAANSVLRIFASPDAGTTKFPRREIGVSAAALAAGDTVITPQETTLTYPIVLPRGWSLYVSIHTTDTLDIWGAGGDY